MRIDLHTHSSASDGTDSPDVLVRHAAVARLDVVALTDHDTTAGWDAAIAALPPGLVLVPGVELSCASSGISMHLLGYLVDPRHPGLSAATARARDDRVPRAREIVRRLRADRIPITWADVERVAGKGATLGRPHVADALVAAGVVRDRDAAFAGLLSSRSPYYVTHYAIPAVDAVRLVRDAGGVSVFAHPRAHLRGRIVPDETIADLADAGLCGIEVDHRDHDDQARAHLRGLARELGLLVTGASDYHGTGKANRLGENTTDPDVYEALVTAASGAIAPVAA